MASGLLARHKWMADVVATTFDLDYDAVCDVFREHANLKRINDWLEGKSQSHRWSKHIFVYYQTPDIRTAGEQIVDSAGQEKLFLTDGCADRLKSKAVAFIRNPPSAHGSIDMSVDAAESVE